MGYIRQTFYAGKTVVVREFMKRTIEKGKTRAPKTQVSSDKVWEYNLQSSIFKLTLQLNHNFKPGDHHLQLTYEIDPEDREAAKKDLKQFTRKLSRLCKKLGIEFKWVAVTEKKGKNGNRFHHHIICSGIPTELILKCWPHGTVFHNPLWDDPDYSKLASYLLKEAASLHAEEGLISKRRYTTSRNVVMPQGVEEEIKRKDIQDEPSPHKGYQLKQDTVENYENELTDTICRRYIMVEDEAAKRYKRSGKKIKSTGEYINWSRALDNAYDEYQTTLADIGLIL